MEGAVEEEDEGGRVLARIKNLTIETAVTEEDAAEGLVAALEMEVGEYRGSGGEEEGGEAICYDRQGSDKRMDEQ